ncbi:MAG: hypothetical protein IPN95_04230 [Bacteroidetes bacterium]|nr:hypothetical protein [Bacteroidota bacterium]
MDAAKKRDRSWGRKEFFLGMFLVAGLTNGVAAADLEKEFVWKSFGESETLKVKVPEAMHSHYAGKTRSYQYGNYIKEDVGFELTARLAAAFDRRAIEENLTEWEKINMVIDFVQSLQYQTETGEYPKYPIETLRDGGGDCEDTSILLAAVLDKMGIDCVLLSPPGHMSVGLSITGLTGQHYLWAGKKYFYVETTGQNWEVGAVPAAYQGTAKIYALPASTTERHTAVAHTIATDEPAEEALLLLAFHRSPNGFEDPKTHKKVYQYSVHLESDAATLGEIQEVQYRKVASSTAEQGKILWMRAYDLENQFRQEWTDAGHVPIQVRIFFKDGSMVQTLIDFAPNITAD